MRRIWWLVGCSWLVGGALVAGGCGLPGDAPALERGSGDGARPKPSVGGAGGDGGATASGGVGGVAGAGGFGGSDGAGGSAGAGGDGGFAGAGGFGGRGGTGSAFDCGDGSCDPGENCVGCGVDCGACAPTCGDGGCGAGEDCVNCPTDCGVCPPVCGNGACEGGEDCTSCASDCGSCGPFCGNGACEGGEDCASCASDCGGCGPSCGNGACEGGEDCASCASDCGGCAATEVHVAGGDCQALQAGLDQAAAAILPLRLSGNFTVDCVVRIPSDVHIDATAATLTFTKRGRIRNATNGGGGGYTHAGGFVWDGGTLVGAGNGLFTISHAPGFTIRNAVLYAYADAGDDGHAIEVNSSGGRHTPGTYTVHLTGNTFLGVTGQRANSNDEAVQYDFSWDGSGGDPPFDETMTHNLYIANNTFHRLDETGAWEFALTAIGGHRGGAGEPAERHNGLLIEGNRIHGAVGATENVSPNKGAIALWNARDVIIRDNDFHGCTASRLVSAWDANPDRALNDATMNLDLSGNRHNGAPVTIRMPSSNTTGG